VHTFDNRITKANFNPFRIGFIANPWPLPDATYKLKYKNVDLDFPSRLNAMAIDPSLIAFNKNRQFAPGEIVFAVDLPLRVKAVYQEDGLGEIRTNHSRRSIARHSGLLMKAALGFSGSVDLDISGREYPHCGLGSSGRLASAVAAAINELFGRPLSSQNLVRYLAQNHGEEIKQSSDYLMPVQCIGGAAAAGFYSGGCLVIAGHSVVIAQAEIPEDYRFVIGWPRDFEPPDALEAMNDEINNLDYFIAVGKKNGGIIAYRILHELLPAIAEKDYHTVGEVIKWYRFQLGSIQACSFTYPRLPELAAAVIKLWHASLADVVSLSSVGPGFFALTKNPDLCVRHFETLDCYTMVCKASNHGYRVHKLEE
jgi:predicted sugar kinase